MRIGLVQVTQETSSFNPTLTTLTDFETFGIHHGDEMFASAGAEGLIGGYLDAIASAGHDVETVPIVRGAARSGGRLSTEVFEFFDAAVGDGLRKAGALDGLVMLLHGAASAEGIDDVEGALLATARSVVGDIPLALMLDHHANVTDQIVELADVIVGFRTQPHDQFETARDLTLHGLAMFRGEVKPTMAWRKLAMMTHQEQYLTAHGPMKVLFDRAREMEQDSRILAASPFPMQPWLDAEQAGWSMVVVTDGDAELAEHAADELAELAWSMRDEFQVTESLAVDDAVVAAASHAAGLVLLSDTGDSVLGGSGGDSTVLLEALLRLDTGGARALVPMIDTDSARMLFAHGTGSHATLLLGGTSCPLFAPLEVSGTVGAVADGELLIPDHPEGVVDMGKTVRFDVGSVTLLVSEFAGVAGVHPNAYRHVGIEPADFKMVVMKTASNFQYFAPLTTTMIRAETPGPTQSDIAGLPWEHIPRPMFPLDPITSWRR